VEEDIRKMSCEELNREHQSAKAHGNLDSVITPVDFEMI
jgi:hypothetical protein